SGFPVSPRALYKLTRLRPARLATSPIPRARATTPDASPTKSASPLSSGGSGFARLAPTWPNGGPPSPSSAARRSTFRHSGCASIERPVQARAFPVAGVAHLPDERLSLCRRDAARRQGLAGRRRAEHIHRVEQGLLRPCRYRAVVPHRLEHV